MFSKCLISAVYPNCFYFFCVFQYIYIYICQTDQTQMIILCTYWLNKGTNYTQITLDVNGSWYIEGHPTLSLISIIRERLKPEFLFSDLMALMAPDLISIFACSVAVAVSTTGWSDSAVMKESVNKQGELSLFSYTSVTVFSITFKVTECNATMGDSSVWFSKNKRT